MSYSKLIPLFSRTATSEGDGALIGSIPKAALTGVYFNVLLSDEVNSYRYDKGAGGSLVNLTSTITTAAGEYPFGSTVANISDGDILYIAPNSTAAAASAAKEIYAQVLIAGVGTWTMDAYDSSDGKTTGRALTNVNDPSNGFRNSGTFKITFDASTSQDFSPAPDDTSVPIRKYLAFKLSGVSNVTVAPKIRIWIVDKSQTDVWMDATFFYSGDMESNNFTGFPDSYLPVVGSKALYVSSDGPFTSFDIKSYRAQAANICNWVQRYSSSATLTAGYPGFTLVTGVNDGSADFSVGPATLGGTPVETRMTWTFPDNWASVSMSIKLTNGTTVTVSGYMLEATCDTVYVQTPTTTPLSRMRARVLGPSATGIRFPYAGNIAGVSLEKPATVTGTGDITGQFINITQRKAAQFTIPSAAAWPYNANDGSTPAMSPMQHNKNDLVAMFYNAGTRELTSVPFTIHSVKS